MTQNSSSLGLLLLTRILKVPVLLSRPGLSSHLSCRSQLSTLLPRLATTSCLCGYPGCWGFIQAFSCWYCWEPQGPGRPGVSPAWRTPGREHLLLRPLPHTGATSQGSHRKPEWEPLASNHRLRAWHGQAPSEAFHTFFQSWCTPGLPTPPSFYPSAPADHPHLAAPSHSPTPTPDMAPSQVSRGYLEVAWPSRTPAGRKSKPTCSRAPRPVSGLTFLLPGLSVSQHLPNLSLLY